MPELPEVEVLRLSLERRLPGQRFVGLSVSKLSLREPIRAAELKKHTLGRRILALRRRAKYLLIDLEGGSTLVIHLGMSGRLTLVPAAAPREAHEHLRFELASGEQLRFRDPRRFGLAFALPTDEIEEDRRFRHLGIEPLAGELTGAFLAEQARGRRGPVKSFLMDGRIVVGVGNIYASEALFLAGIHPNRSVAKIGRERWDKLAAAVQTVLGRAIAQGGTTLNDFADGEGKTGYFQVSLAVYGREGEPCRSCGTPIRRRLHAGRSTFYCSTCQR